MDATNKNIWILRYAIIHTLCHHSFFHDLYLYYLHLNPPGTWCWISDPDSRIFMAYIPLWGSIVLVAVLNIDIVVRIRSSLIPRTGDQQTTLSGKTKKEFIRLIVICILYAVVHVPASYVRVMGAMNKVVEPKLNMIMVLAFAISLPLPGILNFFIWVVSDEQVINDWWNLFGLRSLSPFKASSILNMRYSGGGGSVLEGMEGEEINRRNSRRKSSLLLSNGFSILSTAILSRHGSGIQPRGSISGRTSAPSCGGSGTSPVRVVRRYSNTVVPVACKEPDKKYEVVE